MEKTRFYRQIYSLSFNNYKVNFNEGIQDEPNRYLMINKIKLKALCLLISFYPAARQCFAQRKIREVPVTKVGEYFEIKVGTSVMQIDPASGGRVRKLMHNDVNFLTDSTVNSFNYGSTFWLSPQSDWELASIGRD